MIVSCIQSSPGRR